MPEEHVMLIDETQEKRPHKSFSRYPNKWLKKSGFAGSKPSKYRREKRSTIVRNKQAASLLNRCWSASSRPFVAVWRSSSSPYCKLICLLIIVSLLFVIYSNRQHNNIVVSPSSLLAGSESPLTSVSNSSARNVSFVQNVYYTSSNEATTNHTQLKLCPPMPANLVGRLNVTTSVVDMEDIEFLFPNIVIGGHYLPENCAARDRVAIIIPYRNREKHLATLLVNLHPMLMRQNIDYTIFVVEQVGTGSFNRAKLFNVGYFEAIKHSEFDCFIFHDVDLVPEDDRNLYTCPPTPRHMSVAVDKFNYKLPYKTIFGGVCAMTMTQFKKVNGFSNQFWGWGGEDDDMYKRITFQNMKITRYSEDIARYKMLKHGQQENINRDRFSQLKKTSKTWRLDGLNSCSYRIESIIYKKLFTHILVDLLHPS